MASKNPKPHLKLLGRSDATFPKKPTRETLETFPNRNKTRAYTVRFECPEFTSLCPVTGQADFATVSIQYIPDEVCIETKSLKFYLSSFRSTPSFGEDIANRILDDLAAVLKPRHITVNADFAPRGGISLHVEAGHDDDPFDGIPF